MDDWNQQQMFQQHQQEMEQQQRTAEQQRQAEEEQRRIMAAAAYEAGSKTPGRKKITYRPSKANGIIGGIAGGIFVLLGLFFVIPSFGPFGIVWTLFALIMCVSSLYSSFGKKYVGPEIHVENMEEDTASPEERLQKLRSLYEQRLITKEEYEQKRAEILKDL